jgi:glycosyltransferase involved in cell wall biosynthesis
MSGRTLVQVVQHMRPGGIEKLALDLLKEPPVGSEAIIVSLEGESEGAFATWPDLRHFADRIVFLGKCHGIDASLPLKLVRLFRQVGARYVHTHHIGPLLYAGLACRLAGIKVLVHTEHDAWHLENQRLAQLTRLACRFLRPRLVADAKQVADRLVASTGGRVDAVIVNGIDTNKFSPECRKIARRRLNLPLQRTIIGLAGRLEPVKNQQVAIAALADFDKDALLVIAGSGSQYKALQRTAINHRVDDRVRFLGYVDDMPAFYNAIDLFCLPSLKEGLPLSLLEAQSCNTPVVASDVGGVGEATCPETGRLVTPSDVGTLPSAWRAVLSQSNTKTPRAFAIRVGSMERMREAYRKVLEQ